MLPYVRLFADLVTEVGCAGRTYEQQLEAIQTHLGGFGAYGALHIDATDPHRCRPTFAISGKALERKAVKLFTMMLELVQSVDLTDERRLHELVLQEYTDLEQDLPQEGLHYATHLAASRLTGPNRMAQIWNGLDYYEFLRTLSREWDTHRHALLHNLEECKRLLLGALQADLVVGCSDETWARLQDEELFGLTQLPLHKATPFTQSPAPLALTSQGRIIASPVAFTAISLPTVPFTDPQAPATDITARLLTNTTLHRRIREQGGAYGGGASGSSYSGRFNFYSYRDPHLANTLDSFAKSLQAATEGHFQPRDLDEAKLALLQKLDTPVSPSGRAMAAYSWRRAGATLPLRQLYRDRLFATTAADIRAVSHTLQEQLPSAPVVCFAGKQLLEREAPRLGKPLQIEAI
jgi:Zn-dependent M16 (insulinase) family peptidase